MALSEVQQHLFNYFKTVHTSTYKETKEFYNQLTEKESFLDNVEEEISVINQIIKNYDFEIVEFVDELTCQKLYILVNMVQDEITQKAKSYDKNLLQFFSEIVKECIKSENGTITETHCLNLSSQAGLTKTASQNALDVFIRDKWIIPMNGSISLGMRAIAELQQSIKQLYANDVTYCPLCKNLIMQGFNCMNCNAKYHLACLKRLKAHRAKITCTECKEDFQDLPAQVIEENESDNEHSTMPSTSQPSKRKKVY